MSLKASIAVLRFGLGAKPGEIDSAARNPTDYLLSQLHGSPSLPAKDLPTSKQALGDFREFHKKRKQARAERATMSSSGSDGAMKPIRMVNPGNVTYRREIDSRLQAFATTDAPFLERLVLFWANHFAISAKQPILSGMAGAYEREAIRPHVTGNFADLLIAASQHPAMLLFLNNRSSTGPNSVAGKRHNKGLNENHAREIFELHTVGVDGGYTTNDIIELAKAMTGWSVSGRKPRRHEPNVFMFKKNSHEPGNRTVFGKTYADRPSTETGEDILRDLAINPNTARFLATALASYFVADKPSEQLISAMADAYLRSRGKLIDIYEVLISHPDSRLPELRKFKSPLDFVASSVRGFGLENDSRFWQRSLLTMGQRMWAPPSPKGWPNDKKSWVSSDSIKTRLDVAVEASKRILINFDVEKRAKELLAERLSDETSTAILRAADGPQALTLLLMSPEFQRR